MFIRWTAFLQDHVEAVSCRMQMGKSGVHSGLQDVQLINNNTCNALVLNDRRDDSHHTPFINIALW